MYHLIHFITIFTRPWNGFFTKFANCGWYQTRTAHSAWISIEHIKKYKYYSY